MFARLGSIYHLWTQEDFEIIFTCDDDFKVGMNIVGLCAQLYSSVAILTFELMSNHIHFTLCGHEEVIVEFFETIKKHLCKFFSKQGRNIRWNGFQQKHRLIKSLGEARNVIVYNNRNGFLVNDDYTPFSYPWGANRYYFHQDAKILASEHALPASVRFRRSYLFSHIADELTDFLIFEDYALPLSFCRVDLGEGLFTSASNYFYRLSKNVESMKEIAKEIGESVFYTDDELFSTTSRICKTRYGYANPGQIPADAKLEIAKTLKFEYNANAKQISRILKVTLQNLASIGI